MEEKNRFYEEEFAQLQLLDKERLESLSNLKNYLVLEGKDNLSSR